MVDIKKVQARLLDMAVAISKILEKHNMPYMLTYGTLLGAIRHKGFIPWDDDFDFYLFDDTYDEAIEYLRNELPQQFFVEDSKSEPLYFHAWARVKDFYTEMNNVMFSQDNVYAHKGLSVDLFKASKVRLCDVQQYLNAENRKYIKRRKELNLISEEDYARRMKILENNEKESLEYNDGDKKLVYGLINIYKCKYLEIEEVFPLVKYEFEGYMFYGPNKAHEILSHIYGDYMQLPNVEDRKPHYGEVKFLE